MKIRVRAFEPASRANGPGLRAVVWFQGCTRACPGCFNPATHDPRGGDECETHPLSLSRARETAMLAAWASRNAKPASDARV
jgi:pyruvate-formate lyase-activating enzyme